MINYGRIVIAIAIMAVVTYLTRMLPMVLLKKRITNTYIKSFLYYVPYVVLSAMTFPEALYSTASMISALVGIATALFLGWKGYSLLPVAITSVGAVFLCERILVLIL